MAQEITITFQQKRIIKLVLAPLKAIYGEPHAWNDAQIKQIALELWTKALRQFTDDEELSNAVADVALSHNKRGFPTPEHVASAIYKQRSLKAPVPPASTPEPHQREDRTGYAAQWDALDEETQADLKALLLHEFCQKHNKHVEGCFFISFPFFVQFVKDGRLEPWLAARRTRAAA